MVTEAGGVVPAFALRDQHGEVITDGDLRGAWSVLYWYPKADTPGCSAQAQGLRDRLELFDAVGARVVGLSFDPVEDLAAFASKFDLNFTLLADPDREVGIAFGVAGTDGNAAHADRTAFVADDTGTIRYRFEVGDPEFFADHVLDLLEELQP